MFFFLLLRVFAPVRILHFDRKTTDIIIAPTEKLRLPDPYDLSGPLDDFFPGFRKRPLPAGQAAGKEAGFPETEALEMLKISPKTEEKKEERVSVPGPGSEFSLSRATEGRLGPPAPGKTGLSLSPVKPEKGHLDPGRYAARAEVNLRRYLYPQSAGAGIPGTRTSRGRPVGSARSRVSLAGLNYDLTPWARNVIDRIQVNWLISAERAQDLPGKTEVKVAVVIGKNGELSSVEVVGSSEIPFLDQSALRAIELSSPFPGLPPGFPEESVEVLIVFQHHG